MSQYFGHSLAVALFSHEAGEFITDDRCWLDMMSAFTT